MGKSGAVRIVNVAAVNNDRYLLFFCLRCSVSTISDGFDSASPRRHTVWLYFFHSCRIHLQQRLTNVSVLPEITAAETEMAGEARRSAGRLPGLRCSVEPTRRRKFF